jgi:hypothetical protein
MAIEVCIHVIEATDILRSLGMPKDQQNARTALCLLALAGITAEMDWTAGTAPLIGITPIMDFSRKYYGARYAPNSRETFRRFSIHQLVQAHIVAYNPDDPGRAVNSPNVVYQLQNDALDLVKTYGTTAWDAKLAAYRKNGESMVDRYAMRRTRLMVPVNISGGNSIELSPGPHSTLIKKILEDLAPQFFPGSSVVYVGDTETKFAFEDQKLAKSLNLKRDAHGKMPDVILYDTKRKWLVLIESVTSHGPVDSNRQMELIQLFADVPVGKVYISAFPNRRVMSRYLNVIAWETEVWVADAPTHLVHFNGDKFLGPYVNSAG